MAVYSNVQCMAVILAVSAYIIFRIPLCTLINQYLYQLANKFPATKCMKSISTTCIPNYPDKNVPTIFIYYEGDMKKQFVGPLEFGGMNLKIEGSLIICNNYLITFL